MATNENIFTWRIDITVKNNHMSVNHWNILIHNYHANFSILSCRRLTLDLLQIWVLCRNFQKSLEMTGGFSMILNLLAIYIEGILLSSFIVIMFFKIVLKVQLSTFAQITQNVPSTARGRCQVNSFYFLEQT